MILGGTQRPRPKSPQGGAFRAASSVNFSGGHFPKKQSIFSLSKSGEVPQKPFTPQARFALDK